MFQKMLKAIENGDLELLKHVISYGNDINCKYRSNSVTALHIAVQDKKNVDIVKYLVEHGANVNQCDNFDMTPLHHACREKENVEIVKIWLKHGTDVNASAKDNTTPLHLAAYTKNNIKVVELLVNHGAHLNVKNHAGQT